eukprot:scaffold78600_cov18-Tisochrysis_lutea.AAC.3
MGTALCLLTSSLLVLQAAAMHTCSASCRDHGRRAAHSKSKASGRGVCVCSRLVDLPGQQQKCDTSLR